MNLEKEENFLDFKLLNKKRAKSKANFKHKKKKKKNLKQIIQIR